MSAIATNEDGDIFKYFLKLSFKDQFRVIVHLPLEDRIRFSFASRLACLQSAFMCFNYHGFELYGFSATNWRIYGVKNAYEKNEERRDGFILDFFKDKESAYVRCSDISGTELWEEDLSMKINLFKLATDYFKSLLTVNMNTMKKLIICGHNLRDIDFGITSMRYLESLEIDGDADIHQFLPTIGHPLKNLVVRSRTDGKPLSKYKQIYHVSHSLHLTYSSLTYKQFRKLRAPCVCFSIGDLTPEEIHRFINGFKEVDFYEELGEYQWNIRYSGFDVEKLFKLLNISEQESKEEFIEIKQVSYPKKSGELTVTKSTIKFSWDMTSKPEEFGNEDKTLAE